MDRTIPAATYSHKLSTGKALDFSTRGDVFYPTATSLALIEGFRKKATTRGKTLDLGCGCGVVGIMGHELGLVQPPLYASDVSSAAIETANENGLRHGCAVEGRAGSLFEPWIDQKFDYILDDVSGVAEDIAKVSPWFRNVPCNSGVDGTDLVKRVIQQAPGHLNPEGCLFFPIISLSDGTKILAEAENHFTKVERIVHTEWPLPEEMRPHIDLLIRLQEKGHISFQRKFGMVILFTDIYAATGLRPRSNF